MLRAQTLVILLLFVASYGYGQTVATKKLSSPAISISVTPPSDPVHLGSPIPLKVVVKNISGKQIGWESAHYNTAYKAFGVLLVQNGQKAKTTSFQRRIANERLPDDPQGVENSDTTLFLLKPEESLTFTIDVTKLYQVTEPGTYKVDVSRFDESSNTVVHGNPVTVEIVP